MKKSLRIFAAALAALCLLAGCLSVSVFSEEDEDFAGYEYDVPGHEAYFHKPAHLMTDEDLWSEGLLNSEYYSTKVYLPESERDELLKKTENTAIKDLLEKEGAFIAKWTVMPLYRADFDEFVKTGQVNCIPYTSNGKQVYMADLCKTVYEENPKTVHNAFAGVIQFTEDDLLFFHSDGSPVDFTFNVVLVDEKTDQSIIFPSEDCRLIYMQNLGYVYYLTCYTDWDQQGDLETFFLSPHFEGENTEIFNSENLGLITAAECLKAFAESGAAQSVETEMPADAVRESKADSLLNNGIATAGLAPWIGLLFLLNR